jgi:hypothetical protein
LSSSRSGQVGRRQRELDPGARHLDVEPVPQDERVVDAVVQAHPDPVRPQHLALLLDADVAVDHGAQGADARGLQPGAAPRVQGPPAGRLQLGQQVGEGRVREGVPLEVGPHAGENCSSPTVAMSWRSTEAPLA